jgi:hypothetical protein
MNFRTPGQLWGGRNEEEPTEPERRPVGEPQTPDSIPNPPSIDEPQRRHPISDPKPNKM